MRVPPLVALLVVALALGGLLLLAAPARASADVNLYGYTNGGSFTPIDSGGSMPLGATLEVHVWADLYACDPITVSWGDGTSSSMNFGGSFSETFTHTYAAEGTYTISAQDCAGQGGQTATVVVGGLGNVFDPSSAMFVPSVFGPILGLAALGMALGNAGAAGASGAAASPSDAAWWHPERFKSFAPPSMSTHWVSYRDIPVGAPPQNPDWIQMRPGTPTNVFETPRCPFCGGPLGWTAGGWFCLNPACPGRQGDASPLGRVVHGLETTPPPPVG